MENFQVYFEFTYLHAVFIVGSIFTYIVDLILDVIVAITYLWDALFYNDPEGYWYCFTTFCLVLLPTIAVQIFSIRWHQMDNEANGLNMTKPLWFVHGTLLGVVHRYMLLLSTGFEAMKTGEAIVYERFFQQQSDVCMLRLFDSFTESAPQLVFHIFVIIHKSYILQMPTEKLAWTAISALASLMSFGWGIASYSFAMRMIAKNAEKGKLSWAGYILQSIWRFSMLSARIISLVLLSLALREWTIVVMFVHWLCMTGWVVYQNTDFCQTQWEERLYNAIVGVIYCFAFFNLKEGKSRYRIIIFYAIIILENYAFLFIFSWMWEGPSAHETDKFDLLKENITLASFLIITIGIVLGLSAMMLYYRFFHPAGPINPCVGESVDLKYDFDHEAMSGKENENKKGNVEKRSNETSPDFEIEFEENAYMEKQNMTPPPVPKRKIRHSRSFKKSFSKRDHIPQQRKISYENEMAFPDENLEDNYIQRRSFDESPTTNKTLATTDRGGDSAYGTDSNRTASRNNGSPPQAGNLHEIELHNPNEDHEGTFIQNSSGSSMVNHSSGSSAFNNETYMSIDKENNKDANEDVGYIPQSFDHVVQCNGIESHNNTYQSVNVQSPPCHAFSRTQNDDQKSNKVAKNYTYATPSKLLKRSPIVKDVTVKVTSGFAHISPTQKVVEKSNTETDGTFKVPKNPTDASLGNNAKKTVKERGLNPPLTIIVPNISHRAFASKTNTETKETNLYSSMRGEQHPGSRDSYSKHQHQRQYSEQFSDKTIPLEVLDPTMNGVCDNNIARNPALASHDYENLALININRGAMSVRHWKTYSNMANEEHDNSVSYDRARKLNMTTHSTSSADPNHADYSSLHYFDIYPLSRQMKEQLYRSITPISTAATMASDTQTNVSDSDTYEPIETYAINMGQEDAKAPLKPHHQRTRSICSSSEANVPVPLTLIHHDGKQVSTRHIVTMDSLKEILSKHENVPMDDPQDRGDLYLLAPMRLLTPILEETESEITGGLTAQSREEDFNRSVMTVISEMLTNHSKNMMLYQSILSEKQNQTTNKSQISAGPQAALEIDSIGPFDGIGPHPDGQFQDSVDSASSTLVHTIEEIRNQSLCNLYFYSSSKLADEDHNGHGDGRFKANNNGAAPQVPSKNHFKPIPHEIIENEENVDPIRSHEANYVVKGQEQERERNTNDSFSNASIKSIKSNTLVLSPQKKPSNNENAMNKGKSQKKKKSPLYSSVGTRKNLFQLTDDNSMAAILNTPNRQNEDTKLKLKPSQHQNDTIDDKSVRATNYMDVQDANFLTNVRDTLSSDSESDSEGNPRQLNSGIEALPPLSVPEYHSNSFLCENRSILSPSSKYNTPTPPLRANQFVRNIHPSNRTRKKFSVIRERFESPEMERKVPSNKPRPMITARSNNDLYENISNDFLMLRNSVREKKERESKCKSVPSIVDHQGLKPDENYGPCLRENNENILRPRDLIRNQWSTKSHQNFLDGDKKTSNPLTGNGANVGIGQRNRNYRRSMSILEADARNGCNFVGNKENYNPQVSYDKFIETVNNFPPPLPYKVPPKPEHLRTKSCFDQNAKSHAMNGYYDVENKGSFPPPLLSSSPHVRKNSITKAAQPCYMINTNRLCNPNSSRTSTLSPQSNVFNTSKHYRQSRLI